MLYSAWPMIVERMCPMCMRLATFGEE